MIRSLWLILATMSIANLMIILLGAGWLFTTGRVDAERLSLTRDLYATTVAQATKQAEEQDADKQRKIEELVALGFEDSIPLDAEAAAILIERLDYTQRERFARETANIEVLRSALDSDIRRLEDQREEFERQRDIFERRQQEIADRNGSEQFQKAVKLYAAAKPETAKDMLASLIDQGQTDQVISYLDALKTDVTSKIIEKFREDDPALAADLLERIRAYGVESAIAEAPAGP